MSFASSSLDFGCGIGLWFGGLFTAADLAAADQLVQLSGGGGDESASSSPRSVNTCCTATAAPGDGVEEMGPGLELDVRARKRYRLVSELYAATRPVRGAGAKKRKRYNDDESEAEAEAEMMSFGECH